MALLNGQNVCDTVAFRISNRLAANGTGAGSIIECANLALGLISSAASWEWDQTTILGANPTAGAPNNPDTYTITGADIGKEIAVFNDTNRTRIERSKASDAFSASMGYTGVQSSNSASSVYNTFRVAVTGANADPILYLLPRGNPLPNLIDIIYHVTPPVLVYGNSPTVLWNVKAMDQVLTDLTEAYVKRILGMAGWDIVWSDCIKRISEFKTTYSSQRENTGPADEEKVSAEEKQLGRD